jgi:hypothetical protein
MQPSTISSKNPTRSAQYIICINNMNQDSYYISIGTICTRACLAQKKMLESATLDNVVPNIHYNDLLLLWKASCDDGATCDDMHVL